MAHNDRSAENGATLQSVVPCCTFLQMFAFSVSVLVKTQFYAAQTSHMKLHHTHKVLSHSADTEINRHGARTRKHTQTDTHTRLFEPTAT